MREHKYRGMTKEGKWVYGSLVQLNSGLCYIIANIHGLHLPLDRKLMCEFTDQVLPETVGQFTGLHDSEGRESCHKDICLYADDSGTTQTGIIEWSDTRAAFYIEAIGGDDEGNQDGDLDRPFKVVGNKWENKELLNDSK